MCTLTWWRNGNGTGTYEVFFNRDEKKTRGVAEPPKVINDFGVEFVAPIDPDGGGTWMFANERGLLVCLLNRWHEERGTPEGPPMSRGKLVLEMAGLDYVPAVGEVLRRSALEHVRPFTLVAFDRTGEEGWNWDGHVLSRASLGLPVSSSSFHTEEVIASRRARLQDICRGGEVRQEVLESYHSDTCDGPSPFTVRMNRPDAQTMSRSHVKVGPESVDWTYLEEQPDLRGTPKTVQCSLALH